MIGFTTRLALSVVAISGPDGADARTTYGDFYGCDTPAMFP